MIDPSARDNRSGQSSYVKLSGEGRLWYLAVMSDNSAFPLRLINNAQRLIFDARLLDEHGRYASAVALATLALEELGKCTLLRWQAVARRQISHPRNSTSHIRKQAAVASLLLANLIEEQFGLRVRGGERENVKDEVLSLLLDSPMAKDVYWTRAGISDLLKQIALYEDESPIVPDITRDQIGSDEVASILGDCEKVAFAWKSSNAVNAGLVIYEMDYGRAGWVLEALRSQRQSR